ncbi:hypothetical protein KIPB_007354 [Kipferlia bialata]|uniref:J domain-containing protein n=1 Tax=Kipferlia bialata TaxID=797122 RepID=A0A9K3GKI6_9EUKA|nr:hypothetical protein KIPB_007354 [Kipferlia bialata]|eukprot:g7354.t1
MAMRRWQQSRYKHRNHGNEEEAAEQFKLIQNAYNVLSDPQERAFYDRHKDDILSGGANSLDTDTELNIYSFFRRGCYGEVNDSKNGFYTVYAEVFQTLLKEEEQARAAKKDKDVKPIALPLFGNSTTPLPKVKSFYEAWIKFSSAKHFGHANKWELSKDDDRYTRRNIEKENAVMRDKAKSAFETKIKELVRFVAKRDPRYLQLKKDMALAKKKKQEAKDRRNRERKENQAAEMAAKTEKNAKKNRSKYDPRVDMANIVMPAQGVVKEVLQGEAGISEEMKHDGCVWENEMYICKTCQGQDDCEFATVGLFNTHMQNKKHQRRVADREKMKNPAAIKAAELAAAVAARHAAAQAQAYAKPAQKKGKKKGKRKDR